MTQLEALTAALNAAGLDAKSWKGQRIYLNGLGRDISAYITLDEPASEAEPGSLFSGCALKVFSNAEQDRQWLINRAKQVKHGLMERIHGAGITASPGAPCATWQEVIL